MFDGPDGVGKTTQLHLAKQELGRRGYDLCHTRVNGGSPIGEQLRQVLLSDIERPPETDLHVVIGMYYALAKELATYRHSGTVCLVDRSPLSIMGYQVYGSGIDEKQGLNACKEVLALVEPELIISYQAPFNVLLQRRDQRLAMDITHPTDYFEQKSDHYVMSVMEGFRVAAERFKAISIDAEPDIQSVHETTMEEIGMLLS